MKKVLLAIMVLATLAIPTISSAAPPRQGPYFSGFIGVTMPADADATGAFNDRIEFDPGLNIGGTAGMDFGAVRIEGEISYKDGEIDTITDRSDPNNSIRYGGVEGSIDATAFMANLFLDLHNQGPITPYFGGGVGFAALHQSDTYDRLGNDFYLSDDEVVFAYQAGGGLEIELNRQLSLDLAYRYFRTAEASFADTDLEFESHNATVGFRLKF